MPGEYHLMIDNSGATITGIIPMQQIVAFETCCDTASNQQLSLYAKSNSDMFEPERAKGKPVY